MQKMCGFYVSNIHLITMLLPFIKEQFKKEVKIETFFEENMNDSVNKMLLNLITNENNKENILNINWKNTDIKKYINIEKTLKEIINPYKENIIIISGNRQYINETNKILSNFLKRNIYEKITVINFYKVLEFEDNIREILDIHDYIINTSGIHQIEDVFEEYKKAN